jgi:hypothetical protein
MGTVMALPMLEAMLPNTLLGAAAPAKPPVRMAFLSIPNGVNVERWTPKGEGSNWELPETMQSLAKFKSEMLVLGGMTLNGGRALGDGPGDHARSAASFLTGAHPAKTSGADIKNGQSVDQAAAERIGHLTRFASLELGIERSAQAGSCDSGYSCAYSSNIAWRSETSPLAKEIDPRSVFDRLFGEAGAELDKSRAKRDKYRKSILDFVQEDAKSLQRQLGISDQRKLDEYMYAVREIEQRLVRVEKLGQSKDDESPNYPRPVGVPREFSAHVRLMFDLIALAFQTDSTRVISFMYANEGSNRSYPTAEVREGHHELSHHGRNKDKLEKIARIDKYHIDEFAYLVEKMSQIEEPGGGKLLDNCMLMIGSGLGDGDRHNHEDLPILMVGRGGGTIKPDRHVRYPRETPLTNLYRAMLERVGAPVDAFSDSTGVLEGLDG